jgi:ribosomal protein S27AE
MATRRLDYPIEPMTLQNMRENGVRSLAVQCHQCRHEVVMNVDHLPGDLTVPSFGPRMVCTKCGMIGADARPNWQTDGSDARIYFSGAIDGEPTVSFSSSEACSKCRAAAERKMRAACGSLMSLANSRQSSACSR